MTLELLVQTPAERRPQREPHRRLPAGLRRVGARLERGEQAGRGTPAGPDQGNGVGLRAVGGVDDDGLLVGPEREAPPTLVGRGESGPVGRAGGCTQDRCRVERARPGEAPRHEAGPLRWPSLPQGLPPAFQRRGLPGAFPVRRTRSLVGPPDDQRAGSFPSHEHVADHGVRPLDHDRVPARAQELDDDLDRSLPRSLRPELEAEHSLVGWCAHAAHPRSCAQIGRLRGHRTAQAEVATVRAQPPQERSIPEEQGHVTRLTVEPDRPQACPRERLVELAREAPHQDRVEADRHRRKVTGAAHGGRRFQGPGFRGRFLRIVRRPSAVSTRAGARSADPDPPVQERSSASRRRGRRARYAPGLGRGG